jgi:hypothetical protein
VPARLKVNNLINFEIQISESATNLFSYCITYMVTAFKGIIMNNKINENKEEAIEGLDEDSSLGDYPIDTVLIRNETRTVHDVLRRIKNNAFVMNPDFQRGFIWPLDKQSKLIESVLMRIPLPVFYLAEDDKGRMIVVDGLQRLSTFQSFVDNKLKLKLPNQEELNGKFFKDLSPKLQNRVEDCNLILYLIDVKAPEQAKLDIFERVNGGVPLTRQQMRNCLYMGPATTFLKKQASTALFKKATGASLNPDTMRDREFVNRFCTFQILSLNEYKGDMDDFLAKSLKKMSSYKQDELKTLSDQFQLSLTNNLEVFGKHAFRKHTQGQEKRNVLNASLWDVMTTGLSRYPISRVEEKAIQLKAAFWKLMNDSEFEHYITHSTNAVKNVRFRFDAINRMLQEVFDDYSA